MTKKEFELSEMLDIFKEGNHIVYETPAFDLEFSACGCKLFIKQPNTRTEIPITYEKAQDIVFNIEIKKGKIIKGDGHYTEDHGI